MSPLVELITAWDEFTATNPHEVTVETFCNHYLYKPSKRKAPGAALALARRIGRVAAIQRTCVRIAFHDLPEMEPEWYYLLHSIDELKEVRKTEIIGINVLLEPSTGIDIINRMVKAGLLHEEQDVADKRSRLLRLTAKGKVTLKKANQLVEAVTDRLFSPNLQFMWSQMN
jgi:predicted transcriptional regulator